MATKKPSVNKRISTPLGDLRPRNNIQVNTQASGGMELESVDIDEDSWNKKRTTG